MLNSLTKRSCVLYTNIANPQKANKETNLPLKEKEKLREKNKRVKENLQVIAD